MNRLIHQRVENHLGDSLAIPQVDANNAPVVPPTLNPPHQHDFLADLIGRQVTTMMGATHISEFICQ